MKFKRLTLHGFKSFVDKTNIDFPDGITCVVGPNGTGKSNILDSIRWVFGEQSAKELRGGDMEDIIFAGSEKRKGAGYAEVSLTLSDLDDEITRRWGTFSEITISRRFYKTSEREYYINNKKCKLKDIKEIFYDTGLGTKSISIIEQGRVDKIINASPEELRYFFEETAGVTKFKEKKKESERRLNQTRDNLGRINDIISEVKVKMQTLQQQVTTVNRFRELSTKKESLEKQHLAHAYAKAREDISKVVSEINDLKITLASRINEHEQVVSSEMEEMEEVERLREAYKAANARLMDITEKITRTEGEIGVIRSNIEGAEDTKERIHEDIAETEAALKELTERREDTEAARDGIKERHENLSERIGELSERLEDITAKKDDLEGQLDSIDEVFLELTDSLTKNRNEIFEKETYLSTLDGRAKRLEHELAELREEQKEADAKLARAKKDIDELSRDDDALTERESELSETAAALSSEVSELSRQKSDLSVEANTVTKTVSLLSRQIEQETFGGTDADTLKSLGGRLLIDDMEGASTPHLLEAGGIVVFDAARRDEVLATIADAPGTFSFTFTDEADAIKRDITAKDVETVADSLYRIGTVYRKIGEDNRTARLLSLKEELAGAEEKAESLNERLEGIVELLDEKSEEKERIDEELAGVREARSELRVKLSSAKTAFESLSNSTGQLARRIETNERERSLVVTDTTETTARIDELKSISREYGEKLKDVETQKDDLEEGLEDVRTLAENAREELSELKVDERGLSEQLASATKELHLIDQNVNSNTNRLAQAKKRLTSLLTVDMVQWEANIKNHEELLSTLKKERFGVADEVEKLNSNIAALTEQLGKKRKEINDKQNQVRDIEQKVNATEVRQASLRTTLENIQENYSERFNAAVEDEYEHHLVEDFQPRNAKSEISRLDGEIKNLGPLNLAAEQEYEKEHERYEFMTQQRLDLEESIGRIYELINDIDDNTVELFTQTFHAVHANFQNMFQSLFGEGKAELRLTDPENMLTTGVEIFAQPPGKHLQNMNLLSGGEKAMVASTLLFSMFLHKPTPFCFLDEIDAPLDDHNVDRFLATVRKLAQNTQFVMITHNQKTMAFADTIYGVTMQEPGVSTILSVKLDRAS